jgi:hypothetical protein
MFGIGAVENTAGLPEVHGQLIASVSAVTFLGQIEVVRISNPAAVQINSFNFFRIVLPTNNFSNNSNV